MGNESEVKLVEITPSQQTGLFAIGVLGWGCIGYTVYRIIRGISKIAKK